MDIERTLCVWVLLLLNPFVSQVLGQIETIYQVGDSNERISLEKSLVKLLKHIKVEFTYDHIVLWRGVATTSSLECIFEDSNEAIIDESFMVISNNSVGNVFNKSHPNPILLLSCWTSYTKITDVKMMFIHFPLMIGHVIWVDRNTEIQKACETIERVGIYFNQFIIDNDSLSMEMIHRCNLKDAEIENYYKMHKRGNRGVVDMMGSVIVTEADQLPPRSILHYDRKGNLQMDGFVANCIKSFAERHNATLVITPPKQLGMAVHYGVLSNKTFRGLNDVASIVVPLVQGPFLERYYSYPLELMEFCYMIPLPFLMEPNQVFTYIIDSRVMIVITILSFIYGLLLTIGSYKSFRNFTFANIVLNDKSVRVLLGQSFVMPARPCLFMQYVCFLLCYTSLIISTTYQAYLQSNLIHPQLQKQVKSYDDMREAGLKIAISLQESNFIDSTTLMRYGDIFEIIESFDDFLKLRDRMDTRYVFPVSSSRWQVFNHQQRLFQRTMFYYTSNPCLEKMILQSVPLRPDLPYRTLFNRHLFDLHDTGLMNYWLNDNFYLMVRLKYTTFQDLSTPEKHVDSIELKDFKWVWIFYVGCLLTSTIAFVSELAYCHVMSMLRVSRTQ